MRGLQTICSYEPSDHYIIEFKITLPRPPTERISITHRNLHIIDLDKFKLDLTAKLNKIRNSENLQELCNGNRQAIEPTLEINAFEVDKVTTKRRVNP